MLCEVDGDVGPAVRLWPPKKAPGLGPGSRLHCEPPALQPGMCFGREISPEAFFSSPKRIGLLAWKRFPFCAMAPKCQPLFSLTCSLVHFLSRGPQKVIVLYFLAETGEVSPFKSSNASALLTCVIWGTLRVPTILSPQNWLLPISGPSVLGVLHWALGLHWGHDPARRNGQWQPHFGFDGTKVNVPFVGGPFLSVYRLPGA